MASNDETRFGRDLECPDDPDAAISPTVTGDLPTLAGRANLKAAVRRRLVTSPGQLVHRSTYGGGLLDLVETANTPAGRATLAANLRRNLLRDDRLSDVSVGVASGVPSGARAGAVTITTTITARGDDAAEQITVTAKE